MNQILSARRRAVMCRLAAIFLTLAPVLLVASGSRAAEEIAIAVSSGDDVTTVRCNGQLLLEYQQEANPSKIYVSRWFTPGGVQVLRDSPHDHVHHRALMYAVGINDVDFWSEVPDAEYGKQVAAGAPRVRSMTRNGTGRVLLEQPIHWLDLRRELLAVESRAITAHVGVVPGASLLSWAFTLTPCEDKPSLEVWGRHYFGLGMRLVPSMDQASTCVVPEGTRFDSVRGAERLARATWCAWQGQVEGKPVTVAMFDAPTNPRHPATWFTMNAPFAYLSATMDLEQSRLTITRDQPLRATYGIALWDGQVPAEEIERAYQAWWALERGKETTE